MNRKKKIVVAHPGKQHSFRLAEALERKGLLHTYITTVYYNPDKVIYKVLQILLKNSDNVERMKGRVSNTFGKRVKQIGELRGLLLLLLFRIDKRRIIYGKYDIVHKVFSKKVAKYAIKNNVDALVLYDTNGLPGFKIIGKDSNIKRIMDVSIAARNYTIDIYSKEARKGGKIGEEFKKYVEEYINNEKTLNRFIEEIKYVDDFIVPSKFVKRSLIYNNVPEEKIHIVPYGVDINKIKRKQYKEKRLDDKINFIFVGTLGQRKGIGYLLEAVKQINDDRVNLILAGGQNGSDELYKEYEEYYDLIGFVSHDKIIETYKKSDVYIFPTMSEGFSLTILEAMASGLPVITTANSGAEGVVIDDYNGYVIPAGSISDIKDKIIYFLENPDKLEIMGKNARKTAEKFTWDEYEKNVQNTMEKILNSTGAL